MSEASSPDPQKPAGASSRLLVDVGPLVLWIVAYNVANRMWPDEAIFIGTGVYLVATLAAAAYALLWEKRIPLMLAVTAVIVTVFGVATLLFHDARFAYIKPTIIYLLFTVGIIGSLMVRQNIMKSLLGGSFDLPDRAWRIYAIRWSVWFIFLAALNFALWPTYWQGRPEAFWLALADGDAELFWANFKLFGFLPLVLLFSLANMPFILKHAIEPAPEKKTGPAD